MATRTATAKKEEPQGGALVPRLEYAIMMPDLSIHDVLEENLGSEGISAFDLDRVKVPGSGGTTWEIPTIDGIVESKELDGILVYNKTVRVYWQQDYESSGGGTPPDCVSEDCITGIGSPGGNCLVCPFAKFGSLEKGGKAMRGQACKKRRSLFLVRADSLLPLALSVPPSSLQASKKYLLRLAGAQKKIFSVVTRLTLEKTKNQGGLDYSKIHFQVAAPVPADQIKVIEGYVASIKPYLNRAAVSIASEGGPTVDVDDEIPD